LKEGPWEASKPGATVVLCNGACKAAVWDDGAARLPVALVVTQDAAARRWLQFQVIISEKWYCTVG